MTKDDFLVYIILDNIEIKNKQWFEKPQHILQSSVIFIKRFLARRTTNREKTFLIRSAFA